MTVLVPDWEKWVWIELGIHPSSIFNFFSLKGVWVVCVLNIHNLSMAFVPNLPKKSEFELGKPADGLKVLHFSLFFKKVKFKTFNSDPFSLLRRPDFAVSEPGGPTVSAWILLWKLPKCRSSNLPDASLTFTLLLRTAEFCPLPSQITFHNFTVEPSETKLGTCRMCEWLFTSPMRNLASSWQWLFYWFTYILINSSHSKDLNGPGILCPAVHFTS